MLSKMITMWAGAIVDIPAGFVLCDGNNGTPDLRDKFVVGSGSTYAVDATGGALTHTHAASSPPITPGAAATAVIVTDAANHLPPYYSLAYIMKT